MERMESNHRDFIAIKCGNKCCNQKLMLWLYLL